MVLQGVPLAGGGRPMPEGTVAREALAPSADVCRGRPRPQAAFARPFLHRGLASACACCPHPCSVPLSCSLEKYSKGPEKQT